MAYIGKGPGTAVLTSNELGSNIVLSSKIYDGTIAAEDIATGAITTAKVADGAITNVKVSDVANNKITGVMTATQLANTGVTAATYGNATNIPTVTVDAQGRITVASNVTLGSSTQTYTAPQKGNVLVTSNIFELTLSNNFDFRPGASNTITFANISLSAGQSGYIIVRNNSAYTLSANGNVKVVSGALTTLSSTGTYLASYFCDGANVLLSAVSGAMS